MILLSALLPATPERFARWMEEALTRRGHGCTYNPETFALQVDTGHLINLGNLYQDFRQTPLWRRPALLNRFAGALGPQASEEPEPWTEAAPRLLPKLREQAFYGLLALESPGLSCAWEPFAGDDYALGLVQDFPDRVQDVREQDLEAWGLDRGQALSLARQNLASVSSLEGFALVRPGLYRSLWRDAHDASRLTLPGLIRQLELQGAPVAAVPNRDTLLVAGDQDPEALLALLELCATSRAEEPRPIYGPLLRLEGLEWKCFRPEGPLGPVVKAVADHAQAGFYTEQRRLLEKLAQAQGRDVHIAPCSLLQGTARGGLTYTLWIETVTDALLPRADRIVFCMGNPKAPDTTWVRWEDALALAGGLMEPQGLHPERWRVRSFPDPALLARLRELESPPVKD